MSLLMNLFRHQETPDAERGASAILIAVAMVVLLGFAAIAIDATGLGFNERRQDQSAADVGALAAAQSAVLDNLGNGCTGSNADIARCNGAHEAMEVANATLDDPSLADWSDATVCSTPPAGFTATVVTPCVAFDSNIQRAWVRIPTIDTDTNFGFSIGINSIATSAEAIAGAEYEPPGGVLPFLLPGNAAGANYNCLKASSNPNFGSCEDLPVLGNFGSGDIFLYGNDFLGYTPKCSGDTNGRLTANIARGADHPLSKYVAGVTPEIHETLNCPIFGAQPNTLDSQTGIGSSLENGLAYGASLYASAPYPGAIQDTSAPIVREAQGGTPAIQLDDNALWDYLLADPPGSQCDGVGDPIAMGLCLDWAKLTGTEVFKDTLADAKRFGWVPELLEADFTGNPYHIADFRPVFLDTTYYGCSANQCVIMHTPGVADTGVCPANPAETRITCGTPGKKTNTLDAVTAWVLSAEVVPDNAKQPPPGSDNQRTYNLVD